MNIPLEILGMIGGIVLLLISAFKFRSRAPENESEEPPTNPVTDEAQDQIKEDLNTEINKINEIAESDDAADETAKLLNLRRR